MPKIGVQSQAPIFDAGPQMPPENLPDYTVGESFTFDDGRTDTVIDVRGDVVTWRDHLGIIRVKYRNFTIPDISWQNRTRRSTSQTTATPDMLWPLAVGNDARFEFQQTVEANDGSSKREYTQSWECAVAGTESLDVPAGTFNVFKIPCYRYTQGTSNWRQTRTFYYAPAVKHYVMRTDTYSSSPSRRRELVSYGFNSTALPENEQRALNAQLQNALNENADGVASNWRRDDGSLSVTLTPLRTYQDAKGAKCREYSSDYNIRGRTRTNYRNVCKQDGGLWQRVQ